MTREEEINQIIKDEKLDTNKISDGYHTFEELYEHRVALYIALCDSYHGKLYIWKSKKHSDGSEWPGWFLLGINDKSGEQITYHLPISEWDECVLVDILDQAPPFDGHTSADVLQRIKNL